VPNKGNVIGLGLGEKFGKPDLEDLVARAQYLEIQLGLEMPYFLRNLRGL
jgi:hypothetical protein